MTRRRAACGTTAFLALLVSCAGGGTEPAAPAPTPASVPAPIDIPRAPDRPAAAGGDMRALEPFTGDLDALVERGVLRVLVVPSRTHFQVDRGIERGRTVDAAAAFEQFVNQRIAPRSIAVVLTASTETTILGDLVSGQGDVAANVLRTFARDDQVAFAAPMRAGVRELIVTGPGVAPLVSLEDAGGRAIHVRRDSDHHSSLLRLNDQLKKIDRPQAKVVLAAESQTDEALLELVNTGRVPATIVDDYVYDFWRASLANTQVNRDVAVSQDGEIAWVTRKESAKLLALVNEFFSTHRLTFAK